MSDYFRLRTLEVIAASALAFRPFWSGRLLATMSNSPVRMRLALTFSRKEAASPC